MSIDAIKTFGIEGRNAINQLGAHISIYTGSLYAGNMLIKRARWLWPF